MRRRAFSLIELMLAVGIVAFCFLALIGLMPVGLASVKNSREQAAAAGVLDQVASAIRAAASTSGSPGSFRGSGQYADLAWTLGGATVEAEYALSLGGVRTTAANAGFGRLRVHVRLLPPADGFSRGSALVSVAWPLSSQWDAGRGEWDKAKGSVASWLVFLPSNAWQ